MKNADKDCDSKNASFNAGCNIAKKQVATKNVKKPVVTKPKENPPTEVEPQ